ncbi:MAG: DUF5071 domain-containing protein [Leptospiraceae bacterium]|nr:DUF5071 domain-containing protein [Leptospiraceae bacterium]MCP5500340.1 DUF5071 domain-containing protein [Leptospiraceae bacterium]
MNPSSFNISFTYSTDNARLLINLGYPAVSPVLLDIFACIQDFNWPIAKELTPFLISLGRKSLDIVKNIFLTNDAVWKYWVIQEVIARMQTSELEQFIPLLQNLNENLSAEDIKGEVHLAIEEDPYKTIRR